MRQETDGRNSEVFDLLQPVVATLDIELVEVEWVGGTLRVTVDQPGGISTKAVTRASRLISPVLDQQDSISGRYLLEVSSPGIERPLTRPKHFANAIGEQVLVKIGGGTNYQRKDVPSAEPIRRLKGQLLAADDGSITVEATEIDGVELVDSSPVESTYRIELPDITKARTVFDWGPAPKPGGGKPGKGKKGSRGSVKPVSGKKKERSPKKAVPDETVSSKTVSSEAEQTESDEALPEGRRAAEGHTDDALLSDAAGLQRKNLESKTEEVHNGK